MQAIEAVPAPADTQEVQLGAQALIVSGCCGFRGVARCTRAGWPTVGLCCTTQVQEAQEDAGYTLVATESELQAMLEQLRGVTCIAVDCEGVRLGDRVNGGRLTLMQLSARLPAPDDTSQLNVWVVDVLALGDQTFLCETLPSTAYTTAPPPPLSLKSLLEDPAVAKLLFDVRNDAAQMALEFGVQLQSAYDLQLAEVAFRQLKLQNAQYVMPLDKVSRWCTGMRRDPATLVGVQPACQVVENL
jgi:hypothetical protein